MADCARCRRSPLGHGPQALRERADRPAAAPVLLCVLVAVTAVTLTRYMVPPQRFARATVQCKPVAGSAAQPAPEGGFLASTLDFIFVGYRTTKTDPGSIAAFARETVAAVRLRPPTSPIPSPRCSAPSLGSTSLSRRSSTCGSTTATRDSSYSAERFATAITSARLFAPGRSPSHATSAAVCRRECCCARSGKLHVGRRRYRLCLTAASCARCATGSPRARRRAEGLVAAHRRGRG